LGGVAKYLDTVAGVDGSWWMNIFCLTLEICVQGQVFGY